MGRNLEVISAGGNKIPYEGVATLNFKLNNSNENSLSVPFLVSKESLQSPIIGYNVIETFIGPKNSTVQDIQDVFDIDNSTAVSLVGMIKSSWERDDVLSTVKTLKVKASSQAET